jgi:hypothetical protein
MGTPEDKEIKEAYDLLVEKLVSRNVDDVWTQFQRDPGSILVSVQLEDEQEEHLRSGLSARSRRLIPITLLAKMLKTLE